MMIAYLIGALLFGFAAWLAFGVWRSGAVSSGEEIGDRSGAALLLIDLQTVFWDHGPYDEATKAAAHEVILSEVKSAKDKGVPVIAVRQEWSIPSTQMIARLTMKGQAIAGSAGTELVEPFANLADHILVKRVQDAFETVELNCLLSKLNVASLRVVGLDMNYCVLKTSLAARNRGYDVTLVKAGTLASQPTERAEQLLVESGAAIT